MQIPKEQFDKINQYKSLTVSAKVTTPEQKREWTEIQDRIEDVVSEFPGLEVWVA